MAPSQPKLSIIAQFDDVVRYVLALEEGLDDTLRTFLTFVLQQEECRKQWLEATKTIPKQRMIEEDNQSKILHLNSIIYGLKADLQHEQERSSTLENKVSELNQILSNVKKLVCGEDVPEKRKEIMEYLSRLPNTLASRKSREESLDGNQILFDKTDDDLDLDDHIVKQRRPSGKRSSKPDVEHHTPPKRKKSGDQVAVECERRTSLIATTTVTIPPANGNIVARSKIETIPPKGEYNLRSRNSSDAWVENVSAPSAPPPQSRPYNVRSYENVLDDLNFNTVPPSPRRASQTPLPSPSVQCTPIRQCTSASKLSRRPHHFALKTVIRPETCSPCGRKIKFYKQALKCADCRATCHPECKGSVPVPCVPVSHTPTHSSKSCTVADFAPAEPPMVPALIVHCVNEIESRGMKETGLYRVSGSEREIKELKTRILKGKGAPNLSKTDVHAICGVLKDFLRSFETLIPRIMWQKFVSVLDITDAQDGECALYQAISQLPAANRETLAFLILHWQRVAETPEIKMPVKNLASILAPTVIGYSVATLPETTIQEEQCKITLVMQKLLNIPSDYWSRIYNSESDSTQVFKTPDTRPAPEGSILGPISSTGSWSLRSKNTLMGRTPLSPRAVYGGGSLLSRKRFFASPVLR